MKGQKFRQRAHDGEKLVGCWLVLDNPLLGEVMAITGLDYVLVDAEHGRTSPAHLAELVRRLAALPTVVLVRMRDKRPAEVGAMLDLGVDGFVFPNVTSRTEADQLVAATQFPPTGTRGIAVGAIPASRYGLDAMPDYREIGEAITVFCQIESRLGLEKVEEIASCPRLDGLFLGPNDLSADLGCFREYENENFANAVTRIESVARASGKLLATIPHGKADAAQLQARNYCVVPASSDLNLIRDGAAKLVADAKSNAQATSTNLPGY